MEDGRVSQKRNYRSFSRLGKVSGAGVLFNIPGSEKQLTIYAFTPEQMLGVLKIVDTLGNDFSYAYRLAGFIFEKVTDFHLVRTGVIPSNNLYAAWLREFRVKTGMITGRFAAIGTA